MVTACVEGGAAPFANATFGFHAAIVPSSVAKLKPAGLPDASTKSVRAVVGDIPVGEPVGVFLLFGSAGGMVTIKDCFSPGPLYRVATPVALSVTHQALPEVRDRPQEFTNCGSLLSAGPAVLA